MDYKTRASLALTRGFENGERRGGAESERVREGASGRGGGNREYLHIVEDDGQLR